MATKPEPPPPQPLPYVPTREEYNRAAGGVLRQLQNLEDYLKYR